MVISEATGMEASLIARACAGDRIAFDELVCQHYRGVVSLLFRLCGEVRLSEDMTQEAFLRAWMGLPSFQTNASFRSWLYRIAINATLDVLRRKGEEPMDDERLQLLAEPSPGPEQQLIDSEQSELIHAAVDTLSEAARSVLVLREYGGFTYQEIASILEIPIGTVMSRLNYARESLRKLLREKIPSVEYFHA